MSETVLGVIAAAVVVIAITQVAVAVLAVRAAVQALALGRRLEAEIGPVLEQMRYLSADVARSAAILASQAERVDQLASRVTHRFDEFTASPLREGFVARAHDCRGIHRKPPGRGPSPTGAAPRARTRRRQSAGLTGGWPSGTRTQRSAGRVRWGTGVECS